MTAAQSTSPFPASRFARFNPFKTSSAKPSAPPTPEPAYIPYNGPVEPPATLRAPALPDNQARDSWGDLKIDVSRANTHSAGDWGVPDADTEWQSRYGAEVINIASEALAQTRANQAAVAGEASGAPYASLSANNYPSSSPYASNAAYQSTYVDSPAPSPSPSAESPHHFPPSPQHLSPRPPPSSSPRPGKPHKSPKSPRSITNLIAAAFSSSRKGTASVPTSPRHLRPEASSSTMREQSYFSNPVLEPIPDNLRRPSPDGSRSPIMDSMRKQSSDGTRAPIPDVLRSPPRKLQHSASAEWSSAPRARVDSYAPRARVDSYQPAAYQSATTSRLRPSIPAQYTTVEAPSFSLSPSPRKPSFDARDFSLATDVARDHSFDTREPAQSFDTRNPAPSSNAYEPSQYGGEPSQYARDSAPSQYAFEPAEEREREPRPSTQVFGQDVYVRESWAGLPPIVASASSGVSAGSRARGGASGAQPSSSAVQESTAPWISTTFSAPPPSQIAASRSAPPVPTSYPSTVPSSYSPPVSPHPYAYGSTREEEGNEDEFGGNRAIPRFHLPNHRLKASISVPNLRVVHTPPPLSTSPKPKWEPPKGRDKWLSAETWCDALLLPRPRLRLRSLTGKMGASLAGSKPGSAGKGSTSKGSMAAASIGKSTPKSSFAAGTEGDQYASYAATLHSNAPPSSYAYVSTSLTGGYQQQQHASNLHPPDHPHHHQQHLHPTNRIVSPPGSPLARDYAALPGSSIPSRVLAHSRSLVDLVRPEREAIEIVRRIGDEDEDEVAGVGHRRQPSGGRHVEEHRRLASGGARREVDRAEAVAQLETPGAGPSTLRADPRPPHLKPPRPRSFAADDLSLPSPVPSLAKVLEEGTLLESQRAKWQEQATGSLFNKRARNLSRSRAKSLTKGGAADAKAKLKRPEPPAEFDFGLGTVKLEGPSKTYDSGALRKKKPHRVQESIDFLGARALLGNQAPVHIRLEEPRKESGSLRRQRSQTTSEGTYNRSSQGTHVPSHAHSSSLTKTISKTSHSHSHSSSWSRSAGHAVKASVRGAAALCGYDGQPLLTPMSERREEDWGNVRSTDRLSPIAAHSQDGTHLSPTYPARSGTSPTPSKVGIALSTPPPPSASSREEAEELGSGFRFPAHPYAQGGRFTVTPQAGASSSGNTRRGAEYAGAHPSQAGAHASRPSQDGLLHPYAAAQAGQRDSYQRLVAQPRPDSDAPPSAAMWTAYSPSGVLREVLPDDLRYSPYISNFPDSGAQEVEARPRPAYSDPNTPPISPEARNSTMIFDTAGVGEILANAMSSDRRERRERREAARQGLSPRAETNDEPASPSHRVARRPVQYDATRPLYIQSKSDSTAHTLASSRVQPPSPGADFLQMITPAASSSRLADDVAAARGELSAPMSVYPITRVEEVSDHAPSPRYSPIGIGHLETPGQSRANLSSHSSQEVTSSSSSPQMSPRGLGSADDLESFHDLFYRPGASNGQHMPRASSGSGVQIFRPGMERHESIDAALDFVPPFAQAQRGSGVSRGSGLTSLARHVSDELEEIVEYQRLAPDGVHLGEHDDDDDASRYVRDSRYTLEAESKYSRDTESRYTRDTDSRYARDSQYVRDDEAPQYVPLVPQINSRQSVEERIPRSASSDLGDDLGGSPIEEEDDTVQVGLVIPVSTPPASASDPHRSFQGDVAYAHDMSTRVSTRRSDALSPASERVNSLQPPSIQARSSYMTSTSGGSRISGLSDFPVPPPNPDLTPAHMSLLSSYFDGATASTENLADVRPLNPKRTTFGLEEDETVDGHFTAR